MPLCNTLKDSFEPGKTLNKLHQQVSQTWIRPRPSLNEKRVDGLRLGLIYV